MRYEPNKAAASNSAMTLQLHVGIQWRRIGEPRRSEAL
jgi:hypothetical protein